MMILALALAATPLPPRDRISEADLAGHIRVLASDEYEGRKPGTVASGKTLSYIATAFARAGLQPGAADGTWFQAVALVDRSLGASRVHYSQNGKPIEVPDEIVLIGSRPRQDIRAPLAFIGYGVNPGPEVKGRVVLYLGGMPPAALNAPGSEARFEALLNMGALAILNVGASDTKFLGPPGQSVPTWEQVRAQVRKKQVETRRPSAVNAEPPIGFISAAATDRLFAAAGQDAAKLRAAAALPGFKPIALGIDVDVTLTTSVRNYTSHNVVARLPGTGADGEAVAIIGHWDHLGVCRPEGAPDRICNGAVDNASGIAVMIEVAERLASGKRSARDIVFVATTAEEAGLLGATAFVEAPTVPLAKIAGVLNIDTIAIGPRGLPVSAVNRGNTAIDPLIDEAARAQGRPLDRDLDANGFIDRQDGAAFTRAGVPAVMAGGSFADMAKLQAFLGSAYHGPEDEFSDALPLGGAAEDAELHVLIARAMADPKRYQRR